MKPLRCRLGFHVWRDIWRRDERFGQSADERCVRCWAGRYVFRPFWGKDDALVVATDTRLGVAQVQQEIHMAKGMGFAAASKSVQKKEGVSKKSADAIIAAGARNASAKAVKANPNLKRVKGGK